MNQTSATIGLIYRRTKIVATLGPASSDADTIFQLIMAGANVFRLNLSHGTHETHRANYEHIRKAAADAKRPIAILADLCGPKIRVGRFEGGQVELSTGSDVIITTLPVLGTAQRFCSQYAALCQDVVPGSRILLDDGNLELRVKSVAGTEAHCTVVFGGILKDHKGMNLPNVNVSAPALTEKDRVDAAFAASLGVDFIALSFVRSATDLDQLRAHLKAHHSNALIVAKIEKPEALQFIDEILDNSDAIMVARGDLGVELDLDQIPHIQERLVDKARARNKPVIVATQMLESMTTAPRPTRAEVTDVANAVRSGADAVMLSAETAAGRNPVTTVQTMDQIIRRSEDMLFRNGAFGHFDDPTPTEPGTVSLGWLDAEEAVALGAANMSRQLPTVGIATSEPSEGFLRLISSKRPATIVAAPTSNPRCFALGCLAWGVLPINLSGARAAIDKDLIQSLAGSVSQERADGFWLVVSSNDAENASLRVLNAKVALVSGY